MPLNTSSRLALLLLLAGLHQSQSVFQRGSSPVRLRERGWRCQAGGAGRCVGVVGDAVNEAGGTAAFYRHLQGCKSVCGPYGSLWPKPTTPPKISQKLNAFKLEDVAVKVIHL